MNIYLEALGCRLNYSEMDTLGRRLVDAGHHLVAAADLADVCVLNTCAVTGEAARKSRQLARQLARSNPDARLAITGCYATLAPDTAAALPNVEWVVDNSAKERLHELLQPWSVALGADQWRRLAPDAPMPPPSRTRAFIKVQDGCNNHCTFCIVTVARGPERSRSVGEIVAEVQRRVDEGLQEAVLTGVHLGGYRNAGQGLTALVAALLEQTTLPRLRLSSLEPWDIDPHFFALWTQAAGRLCPHLHLPLQAGCDKTLKRMARRTRTADFHALAAAARAQIPGLTLTTDIIVGFPGESTEDFEQSLRFVEEMAFAHIHVFPYSAREGTAAASFGAHVAVDERRGRVAAMEAVARRTGETARRGLLGQTRPVLWESLEQPAGSAAARWSGLTDNYLRVYAPAADGLALENRITPARLLTLDGEALLAELALE